MACESESWHAAPLRWFMPLAEGVAPDELLQVVRVHQVVLELESTLSIAIVGKRRQLPKGDECECVGATGERGERRTDLCV